MGKLADVNDLTKLEAAVQELRNALRLRSRAKREHIIYAGIAKCFEVCLEYAWKYLKRELEVSGIDVFSPKEVVKAAGQAGLIDDVELWLQCINVRNFAVHDYLGVTVDEYLSTIEAFLPLVTALTRGVARSPSKDK